MMRMVDPDIELIMCGSSSPERGMDTYPEWDRVVLDNTYEDADYISLHRYFSYDSKNETTFNCPDEIEDIAHFPSDMSDYIDTVMGAARFLKGKKRSSKDVKVCFDEWGVVHCGNVSPKNQVWDEVSVGENMRSVLDAVIFGSILITFLNKSDVVKIACQSIAIGSLINVDPKGDAIRQATFYPFRDAATYGRGVALNAVVDSPKVLTRGYGEEPAIRTATVFDESKGEITVFAVNLSLNDSIDIEFSLRSFGETEVIDYIQLHDEQPLAGNTFDNPYRILPKHPEFRKNQKIFNLPRISWNVIRFRCDISKEETYEEEKKVD